MNTIELLTNHYAADGIRERLEASLAEAGLDSGALTWQQLAQLDQFHTRGLQAVKELGDLLELEPNQKVLDLGSGLGGPARYLAAVKNCQVVGIDLTPIYVEIAQYLSDRCGLSEKTSFVQGDAAQLKFDDNSFDATITVHVSMNIKEKDGFYAGVHRVLKPGGRFAIYDVANGDVQPVLYPTGWSSEAETSYLSTLAETEHQLKSAGFSIETFEDATQEALDWLEMIQALQTSATDSPKQPELRAVIGSRFGPIFKTMAQNFVEGRTRIVRALVRKGV